LADKKGKDLENFEIPVWIDLSPNWYQKLNKLAREHKKRRADILREALACFTKAEAEKHSPFREAHVKRVDEEAHRLASGQFAKSYWDSLTPAERERVKQERSERAKKLWEWRKAHPKEWEQQKRKK
jgi:predicted transcriptional regulator